MIEFDPDDDDQPVGWVLTRREVLAIFGGVGAIVVAAASSPAALAQGSTASPTAVPIGSPAAPAVPSCVVRPAATEGPYFVEELLERSDIRSDPTSGAVQEGTPLRLGFLVSRLDGSACTAYPGAAVDVWHCNAAGVYSDVTDRSFDTTGQKFLRGYQLTDQNGYAEFTTIYPGWYGGRTVHIHFKVRTAPGATSGHEFTSQLFFDDTFTDQAFSVAPYAAKGARDTRNANDRIYGSGDGDQLLLDVVSEGDGFGATFDIGLQMDLTPSH